MYSGFYNFFFLFLFSVCYYLFFYICTLNLYTESCLLSNDINDYHVVAQGKTTIPGVNDGEEFELTDVRHTFHRACAYASIEYILIDLPVFFSFLFCNVFNIDQTCVVNL